MMPPYGKTIVYSVYDAVNMTDGDYFRICSQLPLYRVDKANRYRRRTDRINCVTAYFLLGLMLKRHFSQRLPETPAFNSFGKPLLENTDIDLSISHCDGAVCCGVSDAGHLGVDTEMKILRCEELADDVLSENEKRIFLGHSAKERYFTEIWTKKEAYLKMLGTGITDEMFTVDTTALDDKASATVLSTFWRGDVCTAVCSHSAAVFHELSIAELIGCFLNDV